MFKPNPIRILLPAVLCLAACFTAVVGADKWGSLKGVLVYDGDAPKRNSIEVKKGVTFCDKLKLVNESLVVHPKTKGIKDIVIQVYLGRGEKNSRVHPSYAATARKRIRMTNKNCRFEPRICVLRTSQTLVLANDDPVGHNMNGNLIDNSPFNKLIPGRGEIEHEKLQRPERFPRIVSCNIHGWMKGYLIVNDHPYVAVTDEQGRFEIKNLPAGPLTFQAWHDLAGYVANVDHQGKTWKRGRFKVNIAPRQTVDLGTVKVAPKAFEK